MFDVIYNEMIHEGNFSFLLLIILVAHFIFDIFIEFRKKGGK